MLHAISHRTGQLVAAGRHLRRQPDSYECPNCGAPVDLRAGQWRDAYFAHSAHQANPDCEDYFPGEYVPQHIGTWQRPLRHVVKIDERGEYLQHATETTELELGTSLESFDLFMSIGYLEQFRLTPARELQKLRFRLKSNDTVLKQISLLSIMTSSEPTRLTVPPSPHEFEFEVVNEFGGTIGDTEFDRVEGLAFAGNVFCTADKNLTRIPPGSQVKWGEEIGFVAVEGVTPPRTIVFRRGPSVEHQRTRWSVWRLKLPEIPDPTVQKWFQDLNYSIAEPRWELEVLSVPQRVAMERDDKLVFLSREPLLLKLNAPHDGANAELFFDSSQIEQQWPVKPTPGLRTVFGALSFGDAVAFTVRLDEDERSRRYVEIEESFDLDAVQKRIAELPQLILRIGEEEFYPFCSGQSLRRGGGGRAPLAKFSIVGLPVQNIDFRFAILFSGESHSFVQGLSLKAAESEIVRILTLKRRGRLKIDAGGFGIIDIEIAREEKVRQTFRKTRIEAWLDSLSAVDTNSESVRGRGKRRNDYGNEWALGSLLDSSAIILSRKRYLAKFARKR